MCLSGMGLPYSRYTGRFLSEKKGSVDSDSLKASRVRREQEKGTMIII